MRFGQISGAVGALALAASGWAQTADPRDLTTVSLEDLMNIQVTSVSEKEQSLSRTGAAVFVITRSDIRRSGMRNIPDLLRMAPGVEVARIDANAWAISIRGFNERYSTKVLVLDRRAERVQPCVFRGLLGPAGCSSRGYRAHRSDSRAGWNGVGRQRRERGHQHHHPQLPGHAGRPDHRRDRLGGECQRIGSIRGQGRQERLLSRLWPVLQGREFYRCRRQPCG